MLSTMTTPMPCIVLISLAKQVLHHTPIEIRFTNLLFYDFNDQQFTSTLIYDQLKYLLLTFQSNCALEDLKINSLSLKTSGVRNYKNSLIYTNATFRNKIG